LRKYPAHFRGRPVFAPALVDTVEERRRHAPVRRLGEGETVCG
jgi:hypothetical protein